MDMNKKILLVDDEPDIRMVVGRRLQSKGFQVKTAENGIFALEECDKDIPDLIILDVMMPELNGFQTARKLKEQEKTKNIPIIMLTAKDQAVDKFWAEQLGIQVYITKPFDDEELLGAIKLLLGS